MNPERSRTTPTSSRPRSSHASHVVWIVLLIACGLGFALDHTIWSAWHPADEAAKVAFEKRDVVQMLRSVGYVPTWIIVSGALFAVRFGHRGAWRMWLVALSAALGGGLAELLKLIAARERPGASGEYIWRGVFSGFTNPTNLGLASSHAGVAFGAAFMLMLLWPRSAWVVLPLAIGCAITRVGTGAHFTSDVCVGALLAYAAARGLFALASRSNARHAV